MACKHERLRTVGDRVFCMECNEELDIAFLEAKNGANKPAGDQPGENPPAKKDTGQKGPENPINDE